MAGVGGLIGPKSGTSKALTTSPDTAMVDS
jgi:hypothetical protein